MNCLDANECSPPQEGNAQPIGKQRGMQVRHRGSMKGRQRGSIKDRQRGDEGQAEGPPAVAVICRLCDPLVLPEAVEQGRRPEDRVDDVTEAGGSWVGLLVQDPQLDTERTRRAQSE